MTVDSLEQLSAVFGRWRRGKRHVREKMPEELVRRARRAAEAHGYDQVVRAAKVDRRRLAGEEAAAEVGVGVSMTPRYSRLELVRPGPSPATSPPFAELETPSGIRVRLYSQTRETLELLSSVCASWSRR